LCLDASFEESVKKQNASYSKILTEYCKLNHLKTYKSLESKNFKQNGRKKKRKNISYFSKFGDRKNWRI